MVLRVFACGVVRAVCLCVCLWDLFLFDSHITEVLLREGRVRLCGGSTLGCSVRPYVRSYVLT